MDDRGTDRPPAPPGDPTATGRQAHHAGPRADASTARRIPDRTDAGAPARRRDRTTGDPSPTDRGTGGRRARGGADSNRATRAAARIDGTSGTRRARPPADTGATRTGATPPPRTTRTPTDTGATRAGDAGAARRIDETLTRLNAAHAGVTLAEPGADAPDVPPPPAPRRLPRPGVGRTLVALFALFVFGATAFQFVVESRLDAAVRTVGALDPESGSIVDAEAQDGAENVLVLGSDPGGSSATGPRADTVLLAHVPADGDGITGIAIPRDLEVNRPPCERWDAASGAYLDETVPAEPRTPLISAYDVGGPRCATRVVQQLTGMAVTRFVGIDLDGIGPVVDALRGVEVCVERPVVDSVLGTVVPAAGTSTLDGAHARDFVQARTVDGEQQAGRGAVERQQRLLAAVVGELLSRDVLLDPGVLGAVTPVLGGALTTDEADLGQVLAVARSLRYLGAEGVTFAVVPTAATTSGLGNAVLRDADAAELFAAVREGTPLPEGNVLAASASPNPAEVTVSVLNASDRRGLAGQIGDTLGGLGFVVGEVGNAAEPVTQTEIRFSPDRAAAASLLAETVPSATPVADPAASGVLQLVLGRSFDGVVRAPTSGGATPDAAAADVRCG